MQRLNLIALGGISCKLPFYHIWINFNNLVPKSDDDHGDDHDHDNNNDDDDDNEVGVVMMMDQLRNNSAHINDEW